MNRQKFDAVEVWKQLEDVMVPRLRLPVIDRAVYSYLVRHSRLERKLRVRFSILGLARHIRLSSGPAREAVRRLVDQGALRLVERSKAGYLVEVPLPEEIRAARPDAVEADRAADLPGTGGLEETDFMKSRELRQAIHARSWGAILTATSCHAAWNATRRRGNAGQETFCAGCTARGAWPPRNSRPAVRAGSAGRWEDAACASR